MGRSNSSLEDCNPNSAGQIHHKRVIIQNKYKENLVGILHETDSKEVVIVCHGFRSCKDRIPMVNLAAAFANEGISAFRFDFAGNGDSEGSFQYGNYYREVDDLRSVMQYFEQEERLVTAIIGHSKGLFFVFSESSSIFLLYIKSCYIELLIRKLFVGGNVVLFYASRFKDVDNVVNISGRFDLRRGIEGRLGKDYLKRIKQYGFIDVANRKGNIEYRVTEESLMDRLTTNTSAACQLIPQTCRVLTIHGSGDKIVPAEDAMEFAKHIFNHKLHIIEGADHEYTSHQNELSSVVLNFVQSGSSHDNAQSENKSRRSFL
ncbi:alpha/beta-Hydrolases superfamily protein [Artemisia annua]|uniref:Alpha/beta-Hydrolases superfamily protein n=1 Tax=Artemisia annua TaxID=35608 RepID=A0A2U1NDX6_ARTAN|nr:alpha/beta-Hydrolases superfamily protein [Artemisia annua]